MSATCNMYSYITYLLILFSALILFGWQLNRRLQPLLKAQPVNRFDKPLERIKGLFTLVLFQRKLFKARFRWSGIMHAVIFLGFLAVLLNTITFLGQAAWPGFELPLFNPHNIVGQIYLLVKELFQLFVLIAVIIAIIRRTVLKPERLTLSGEAVLVLFMIGYLMVVDWVFAGAEIHAAGEVGFWFLPFGTLLAGWLPSSGLLLIHHFAFWSHLVVLLAFLNMLPVTKHFHVVTSAFNIYFRSLGTSKLETLNLEDDDAEHFGCSELEHFHWKSLLDLYSCTECGRCQEVCPAFQTDKPLSPKEMTVAMRNLLKGNNGKTTSDGKSLVGDVVTEDELWACVTCRACEDVCPLGIEYLDRIVGMRRYLVLEESRIDKPTALLFKNLENNGNPWGIGQSKREDWCADLEVPRMRDRKEVDLLFWVGCAGAYDDDSIKTARAMIKILDHAGVNYAILGEEESCTGDAARRLGNEYLYQMMAMGNIETLNNYSFKEILTICPHCLQTLNNEYPDLDGNYQVVNHSTYILRLLQEGKLKFDGNLDTTVTCHDSCYLGRHNDDYESFRELMRRLPGLKLTEMEHNRDDALCCGAGGGNMWREEEKPRINEMRAQEAVATGAEQVCTLCPFCASMFSDGFKDTDNSDKITQIDLAELVAQLLK
jgi:Fe-S oxidoreductase